jgi:hypothetical protein
MGVATSRGSQAGVNVESEDVGRQEEYMNEGGKFKAVEVDQGSVLLGSCGGQKGPSASH